MSFNRLLGVVRQRLWQVPKRPRSTNTASEKLQGPEPPNGFLFNEKVCRYSYVILINAHYF